MIIDKIEFHIVGETDKDYILQVFVYDTDSRYNVLLPKEMYPNDITYGLNMVFSGHYE